MENICRKPATRKMNVIWGNVKHKSCWDCEHVRVGRQFDRWCRIHPESFVYSGFESEVREYGLDQVLLVTNTITYLPIFHLDLTSGLAIRNKINLLPTFS